VSAIPTPAHVAQLADTLRATRARLTERPVTDIIATLGAAGARFLDRTDPLRAEALALLPEESGLSSAMCERVLDGMAADWTAEGLEALVVADLGGAAALDGFVRVGERTTMAVGPALTVQIVAGGVPGVGVSALLRSLVVKGPTLLKPGQGDVVLPTLFARGLGAVDPSLADSLAVVYWPGGSREHEDAALERAEVVTVYGSDETVRVLRARMPDATRLVAYHHRVSVGVVGREALAPSAVDEAATSVARSVAMFDQRGCVSPQVVFVEEAGACSPADFADRLAAALAALEERLPTGALPAGAASTLQQARGTAEIFAASSGGRVWHGGAAAWTVVFETGGAPSTPTAGRFVRVRAVPDADALPAILGPLGPHLQTVGVAGLGARLENVARALGSLGASRVAPFESVPFPPAWWHHDGRGPLLDLVRWVDLATGTTLPGSEPRPAR
jgi:hypothetical protein